MTGESILIVDDNAMNRKLGKLLLEIEHYVVRTAHDAEEALHCLKEFRPRLILMDLQLPGMDGLELTQKLKTDPQYQHIPILILTSYTQKGLEEKALAAGCDGYFQKPFDTLTLPAIVGKHIRKGTNNPEAAN